jgi:hypothetical protein
LIATTVPRLSVEELIDQSDVVAAGQVTRSWAAWDGSHKYIWTHYELSVSAAMKGSPGQSSKGQTLEFAEPGGEIGDRGMAIAGSVRYESGDNVVVFLQRMPNGYLRTAGAGQGRFSIDAAGRIHSGSLTAEIMPSASGAPTGTNLGALNGLTVQDLAGRIRARIAQAAQKQEVVR